MEKRIPIAVRRLTRWVLSKSKGEESSAPVLLPLTPEYDPKKHRVYFDAIESALTDPKREVRNIALTGSYGVGKSSILTEVARRHKRDVIAVSLSTLGFPDDEPLPAGDAANAASTKTNRIQKEIVKQLLYSQDPLKTPGSRYRRTTGFRFWRTLWLTALLSFPVTVVFFLAGWTASLATLIPQPSELPWSEHLIIFVASTALLLSLFALFHNRFQVEKLGAGAATISLSAKSATYFDEYLDEIVYFFEAVKRDTVIFEDIDRFDDAHIFETLRSLNSILNGAKQLKGRKVRFIYAIKDSIFDELGTRAAKEELSDGDADKKTGSQKERRDAAEVEIARANRTKFFDLVIPVVPFITHRSARDLLVQTLSKNLEHSVSDELIDLTARYVADMRLIKNIRNEYAIFKRQVIDSGNLNLSEDGLFAMVLFKSIHLSEFELIKLGTSNLDSLYREGRELVAANIKTLNVTIRGARLRRQRLSISADDAGQLGDLFEDHILLTIRHLGLTAAQTQPRMMDGVEVDDARLHSPEFWETYANHGVIEVSYYRPNYGRHESLSFKRSDVAQAIRRPIDTAAWVKEAQTRFDAEIAKAVANRDFLSHADMSDLMQREEFKLTVGSKEYSFEQRAKKQLGSELAIRLLEAGYIDRNFTLYTSTFYTDRVSATATNYILKNVDPNMIDMHFELESQDVEAILRERGRTMLSEKSAYNVSVLDHLVDSDDADEQGKTEIGLTILGAGQRIPAAEVRAELIGSLNIKEYIDAASVPREPGNLIGWLLVEGVVDDVVATFTGFTAGDTDGLAFAISKSTKFPNFMTTTEVTPSNVGLLVNHGLVQEQVKDAILARFTEFTVGTSQASLTLIARYAVEHDKSLTIEEVTRLARDGVEARLVVALLQHHLGSVGIAELALVLVSLGGEFKKLSAANGRHPRIPNTRANRALVDRLQELEIASTDTEANGEIRVYMKQG